MAPHGDCVWYGAKGSWVARRPADGSETLEWEPRSRGRKYPAHCWTRRKSKSESSAHQDTSRPSPCSVARSASHVGATPTAAPANCTTDNKKCPPRGHLRSQSAGQLLTAPPGLVGLHACIEPSVPGEATMWRPSLRTRLTPIEFEGALGPTSESMLARYFPPSPNPRVASHNLAWQ